MKQEFFLRELTFISEFLVPVHYKGINVNADLRCDFVVMDLVIVELKAVDGIAPVHEAQLLTYMKLLEKPKGILINFNCVNLFKEGQKTFVNEIFRSLPDQ